MKQSRSVVVNIINILLCIRLSAQLVAQRAERARSDALGGVIYVAKSIVVDNVSIDRAGVCSSCIALDELFISSLVHAL